MTQNEQIDSGRFLRHPIFHNHLAGGLGGTDAPGVLPHMNDINNGIGVVGNPGLLVDAPITGGPLPDPATHLSDPRQIDPSLAGTLANASDNSTGTQSAIEKIASSAGGTSQLGPQVSSVPGIMNLPGGGGGSSSPEIIIAVVIVAGVVAFYFWKHHKKSPEKSAE